MPTIATIDGISIRMYYADHDPPHFHAVAGGEEIVVSIASLTVIDGKGSNAMLQKVLTWAAGHQSELALCWVRCRSGQEPGRIKA